MLRVMLRALGMEMEMEMGSQPSPSLHASDWTGSNHDDNINRNTVFLSRHYCDSHDDSLCSISKC